MKIEDCLGTKSCNNCKIYQQVKWEIYKIKSEAIQMFLFDVVWNVSCIVNWYKELNIDDSMLTEYAWVCVDQLSKLKWKMSEELERIFADIKDSPEMVQHHSTNKEIFAEYM